MQLMWKFLVPMLAATVITRNGNHGRFTTFGDYSVSYLKSHFHWSVMCLVTNYFFNVHAEVIILNNCVYQSTIVKDYGLYS